MIIKRVPTFPRQLRNVEFFFWSVFSRIWTEYGRIRTRKNSVFGHFSRSGRSFRWKNYHKCSLFDKNLHVICKGVLVTSSKFKNRQKIFSICYLLKPYRKRCYETRKWPIISIVEVKQEFQNFIANKLSW